MDANDEAVAHAKEVVSRIVEEMLEKAEMISTADRLICAADGDIFAALENALERLQGEIEQLYRLKGRAKEIGINLRSTCNEAAILTSLVKGEHARLAAKASAKRSGGKGGANG